MIDIGPNLLAAAPWIAAAVPWLVIAGWLIGEQSPAIAAAIATVIRAIKEEPK